MSNERLIRLLAGQNLFLGFERINQHLVTNLADLVFCKTAKIVRNPPAMMIGAEFALFATALVAALPPAFRAGRLPPADTLAGR